MKTAPKAPAVTVSTPLLEAVDDALSLLEEHAGYWLPAELGEEALPSLLEQCQRISAEVLAREPEPIRTIHHFNCTGADLFSECLATVANTQVLNDVGPLSAAQNDTVAPSDLISKLHHSPRSVPKSLLSEVFMAGLQVIYEHSCKHGEKLILQDHTHRHFCADQPIEARSTLLKIIEEQFLVLPVVTVCHPLDTFLALSEASGINFSPNTLEEYARRYQLFLDYYKGVPIFKYEDLTANPKMVLADLCAALHLPFDPMILELLPNIIPEDNTDHSGDGIILPSCKDVPEHITDQIRLGGNFAKLCTQLGYTLDIAPLKNRFQEPKKNESNLISTALLEKPAYERSQWFSSKTYALHQKLEETAGGGCPPRLLEIKSLPRSGLHYLKRDIMSALKHRVSFCEWYQEPGCCKKMPCVYSCAVENPDRSGPTELRMVKSHDFALTDPTYPPLPSAQRVILVRDPVFSLTSWWVLDVINAYKEELQKRHLNVAMLYFRHEPFILAAIYQALEEVFEPSYIPNLREWLEAKTKYIIGFCEKWGNHTAQVPPQLQAIVTYEKLPDYISTFLTHFQDVPPLKENHLEGEEKRPEFTPRKDPFSAPVPKLEQFLREHSQAFQDARKVIILADRMGVFSDLQV